MCPHCASTHLMIRQMVGFELLMVYFTGKRKYRCCNCFHSFRMRDRRRFPRAAPPVESRSRQPLR
jgi:transposase-like protein